MLNTYLKQCQTTNGALVALGIVGAVLGVIAWPALAATGSTAPMNWGGMTMELLGGLALFLYGMTQMEVGLKAVAGERMKSILAKLTVNRFAGVGTGAVVTAVIQSSSVTTVLLVGFISAGLMSLPQSVGVIIGAKIGTTITGQIVAFKITKAALAMVAIGFGMLFVSKNEKIKAYGGMLMGLGLVFFGMHVMGEAMHPLRSYQPFLDLMQTMTNPLLAVLVSAIFTGIIQSSSATTAIIIVMASQGFISLDAGIPLVMGANIGTCVTALLAASIGVLTVTAAPVSATTVSVATEQEYRDALDDLSSDITVGPHVIDITADFAITLAGDPTYTGTQPLTINGNGHTIDGGGTHSALFHNTGQALTINNLTLTNGTRNAIALRNVEDRYPRDQIMLLQ